MCFVFFDSKTIIVQDLLLFTPSIAVCTNSISFVLVLWGRIGFDSDSSC